MQVERIDIRGEAGYVVIHQPHAAKEPWNHELRIQGRDYESGKNRLQITLTDKAQPHEVYDAAQRVYTFIEGVEGTNTDVMIVRNLIETVMTQEARFRQ